MKNDLISRRALQQALRRLADETDCDIAVLPDVADLIREAPAVSPESMRPRGQILVSWLGDCRCSLCGDDVDCTKPYCPSCGARLDGKETDGGCRR